MPRRLDVWGLVLAAAVLLGLAGQATIELTGHPAWTDPDGVRVVPPAVIEASP